jgi:hypothetical protein
MVSGAEGGSVGVIKSYLRGFVLVVLTLVGIQVPTLIDQYGNALAQRVSESAHALEEFQDDADKFTNGSIERLIQRYRENSDRIVVEGAESIQAIYRRSQMLEGRFREFQSSRIAAYIQALFRPVHEVRGEVLRSYSFVVPLDSTAVAFGLIFAFVLTFFFEMILRIAVSLLWHRGMSSVPTR